MLSASHPLLKWFSMVSTYLATMLCLPPVLFREKPKKHGRERQGAQKIGKLRSGKCLVLK